MATENTPPAPPAPPAGSTAPVPPAAPPAAPPPPAAPTTKPDNDPAWLPDRLARAGKTAQDELLASLGVTNVEEAKTAVQSAKDAAEKNKSAEERAADYKAKFESTSQEAQRHSVVLKTHAEKLLNALNPEHREAILKIAGDDPVAQLNAVEALGTTWATKDDAKGTPPAAGAAPPAAPPAGNTAPGNTAPAAGNSGSPPDHRAEYERLHKDNPFRGAAYGLEHGQVYDRST